MHLLGLTVCMGIICRSSVGKFRCFYLAATSLQAPCVYGSYVLDIDYWLSVFRYHL